MKMNPLKPLKALAQLVLKSKKIDRHIEDESRKPSPDWFRMITLKKQRLLIKDKIQRMKLKELKQTKGTH
jgi:hypothetical protein